MKKKDISIENNTPFCVSNLREQGQGQPLYLNMPVKKEFKPSMTLLRLRQKIKDLNKFPITLLEIRKLLEEEFRLEWVAKRREEKKQLVEMRQRFKLLEEKRREEKKQLVGIRQLLEEEFRSEWVAKRREEYKEFRLNFCLELAERRRREYKEYKEFRLEWAEKRRKEYKQEKEAWCLAWVQIKKEIQNERKIFDLKALRRVYKHSTSIAQLPKSTSASIKNISSINVFQRSRKRIEEDKKWRLDWEKKEKEKQKIKLLPEYIIFDILDEFPQLKIHLEKWSEKTQKKNFYSIYDEFPRLKPILEEARIRGLTNYISDVEMLQQDYENRPKQSTKQKLIELLEDYTKALSVQKKVDKLQSHIDNTLKALLFAKKNSEKLTNYLECNDKRKIKENLENYFLLCKPENKKKLLSFIISSLKEIEYPISDLRLWAIHKGIVDIPKGFRRKFDIFITKLENEKKQFDEDIIAYSNRLETLRNDLSFLEPTVSRLEYLFKKRGFAEISYTEELLEKSKIARQKKEDERAEKIEIEY